MNRREFLGGALSLSIVGWQRVAEAAGYPKYYAAQFAAASARVSELAKKCPFGFWFLTDLHIPSNRLQSGPLLSAFVKETPLSTVLCGGDLPEAFRGKLPTDRAAVDFAVDSYRDRWVTPIREAGGKVYTARGNHDYAVCTGAGKKTGFTYDGAETRKRVVGDFTEADVVTNPADPEGSYYYFDNPSARVRTIVADTSDSQVAGDVAWGVQYGVHATQMKWLAGEALLGTPAGWSVVVMHHIPVAGFVGSAEDTKLFADFRKMLEAYQSRGVFDYKGEKIDFAKAGGRILIDVTGHHHAERETFLNGILHVTEPCDVAYGDYLIGSQPRQWKLPKKDWNTAAEQTFDAVQFDPAGDRVYFTRVGGGANRVMRLKPLTVRVGERLQLKATDVAGDVRWLCHDADRHTAKPNPKSKYVKLVVCHDDYATVTPEGLLEARAAGPVVAVGYRPDGEREIVPVTVVNS